MTDSKRENYVSVVMNDEELRQIDDWMDGRQPRLRSRSEAIRQLIARGLTAPDNDIVALVAAEGSGAEPMKARMRSRKG